MPAEGMPWIPREEILSFEEIERLVRLLVDLGVTDVRLTGGEPLVRREFPALVGMLRGIEGIEDLSLTTNGYLLAAQAADLVAAGIDRVNVSIDSLARARFFEITRRDALDRVMGGLEAIAAFPRVSPVKVNAVPMPGLGREDVLRFCDLARERGFQVRFIEFMPLDGDRAWRAEEVLTGAEVRAMVEEAGLALVERPREPHSTARVYGFADGRGEIGFVNPVSEPFCADCNRLRLTADGRLRTCLFSLHETDLRGPLRAGADDAELGRVVRDAVWRKELKHRIDEPGFRPPVRTMSAIGG
jgi:cyclic pyranopterin phosphate synthase